MPSIWENLFKLLKKEPFSISMQIQKEFIKRNKENETNMEVFSVKKTPKNKNTEKINKRKKRHYTKG